MFVGVVDLSAVEVDEGDDEVAIVKALEND